MGVSCDFKIFEVTCFLQHLRTDASDHEELMTEPFCVSDVSRDIFDYLSQTMIVDDVRSSYSYRSTVFISYWFFKQTATILRWEWNIMFIIFSHVHSTTCVVQTFQWQISKYLFIGFIIKIFSYFQQFCQEGTVINQKSNHSKVFLKISYFSQESTIARVSFLIKRLFWVGVFLWILRHF